MGNVCPVATGEDPRMYIGLGKFVEIPTLWCVV